MRKTQGGVTTMVVVLVVAFAPAGWAADQVWTAADSPHVFSSDVIIPPGQTVTIEPGAVVRLEGGARLFVQGSLVGPGTSVAPITIEATTNYPSRLIVSGLLQLDHGIVNVVTQPNAGGTLVFNDCAFAGFGILAFAGAPSYVWSLPPFVECNRCTFDGVYVSLDTSTVILRDSQFTNSSCSLGTGHARFDGVTIDNSPLYGLNLYGIDQPFYLDGITVRNAAGAGLDLVAGNFLVSPGVTLEGNLYPVKLGGAGLLPGSVLPTQGNVHDWVELEDASYGIPVPIWSDTGLPYVVSGTTYNAGSTHILPGVTVRLGPNADMWGNDGVKVRGLPEAPVVFERLDPNQAWHGLQYFFRLENCVVDGGVVGARFHSSSLVGFLDNCTLSNNEFGSQNDAIVRKTRFVDNVTGTWGNNWTDSLVGATGANSFEGNTLAVDGTGSLIDAQNNWWGHPSGPASSDNPTGAGDPVTTGVATLPFLTAPPDFFDAPPVVELRRSSFLLEPGSNVIFSWDARDDQAIVAQRIEFDHPLDGVTVIAELGASSRSFEWTVPEVGVIANNVAPTIRVIAIDAAGQEGWDRADFLIPADQPQGTLTLTTDLTGPFNAGTTIGEICWTAEGLSPLGSSVNAALWYDGDRRGTGLGGVTTYLSCLAGTAAAPFVSTDTARIVLTLQDGLNRVKYFFSDTFSIRPDPRLGDAAPEVTLVSPIAGETFEGGTVAPIQWIASDDEGLRGFDVQASFDGGRTWHFIAEDLPPTATGFDWLLPPSGGIAGTRVRVIASDLRFQTSSDGADVTFSILPGTGTGCSAPPGEVHGLVFADPTLLSWSPMGADVVYDVARGDLGAIAAGESPACLVPDLSEAQNVDVEIPSPGQGFAYLTRAGSPCGEGSWGAGTGGVRTAAACP